MTFEKLISWSEHSDPGVKHFSGTATYAKAISVPASLIGKDKRLYLDLGNVAVMAEVTLNGKNLGILWKPPYCVDVTDAVKAGENALELSVVNLWINRMIGDELLPEDSRAIRTARSRHGRSGSGRANRAQPADTRSRAGGCGRRRPAATIRPAGAGDLAGGGALHPWHGSAVTLPRDVVPLGGTP